MLGNRNMVNVGVGKAGSHDSQLLFAKASCGQM